MSRERELLDHAVGSLLSPQLVERGFRQSGRYFYRQKDDFIQLICYEGSWLHWQFSFNLAVSICGIPDFFKEETVFSKRPRFISCVIVKFPNEGWDLETGFRNLGGWWHYKDDQNYLDSLMRRIIPLLDDYVGWLDSRTGYENVISRWKNPADERRLGEESIAWYDNVIAAYAYENLGRADLAHACILNLIQSKVFETRARAIREFCLELAERTRRREDM